MRYSVILILMLFLVSCAKTTVVLLPDSDGKVGKVSVSTSKGTELLTEANHYTKSSSMNSKPAKAKIMEKEEMETVFRSAIATMPKPPVSFLLYFKSGSDILAPESKELVKDVVLSIKERIPCNISIIGHSDTVGAEKYNIKLSLTRAEKIKKLLVSSGVPEEMIKVSSHGEQDLLVETGDNVNEPKNRRVEVMVK